MELTPSAATDEPQIVELGYLVLDQSGRVAQLGRAVLVIAGFERDGRAVRHLGQYDHLERAGQRLVGPPVGGQCAAQHVRAPGAHQLARVLGGHLADGRLGPPQLVVGGRGRRRRSGRRLLRLLMVLLVVVVRGRRGTASSLLAVVIRRHSHQSHVAEIQRSRPAETVVW